MPPRQRLPDDDLYARLGVPVDASPEAIDLAWRALLRRHHPDVAGPEALELAKRLNVAHDWLADPELRRRYDRERGIRPRSPGSGVHGAPDASERGVRPAPSTRRRPATAEERTAAVIERVGHLGSDDLDRLALAEPAPIAFLATLRRFVPSDLQDRLDRAEVAAFERLPVTARALVQVRDAISGKLADTILDEALGELLGDPTATRVRERLTRGWDSAVGRPRYGPGTRAVEGLLDALATRSPGEIRALAAAGDPERLGDEPWPRGTSPDEDDALRVSSELAMADAAEALGGDAPTAARRAAARIAHLLVLRHAFDERTFDRLAAPWVGDLIAADARRTSRVRHRP